MTVAQAAAELGATEKAIRAAIHGRRLTAFKVGGEWRIRPAALKEYEEKQTSAAI